MTITVDLKSQTFDRASLVLKKLLFNTLKKYWTGVDLCLQKLIKSKGFC